MEKKNFRSLDFLRQILSAYLKNVCYAHIWGVGGRQAAFLAKTPVL